MSLGAGCCSTSTPSLFNNFLGSLQGTKNKCQQLGDCGYISHGWRGSTFCSVWSDTADCSALNSGDTDCGSSGSAGAHTYRFYQPWMSLGAGCCSTSTPGLFNNLLGSLQDCKNKCQQFGNCGYISHGWRGSTWCRVWSDTAVALRLILVTQTVARQAVMAYTLTASTSRG